MIYSRFLIIFVVVKLFYFDVNVNELKSEYFLFVSFFLFSWKCLASCSAEVHTNIKSQLNGADFPFRRLIKIVLL